jgi:hypothetical protein
MVNGGVLIVSQNLSWILFQHQTRAPRIEQRFSTQGHHAVPNRIQGLQVFNCQQLQLHRNVFEPNVFKVHPLICPRQSNATPTWVLNPQNEGTSSFAHNNVENFV